MSSLLNSQGTSDLVKGIPPPLAAHQAIAQLQLQVRLEPSVMSRSFIAVRSGKGHCSCRVEAVHCFPLNVSLVSFDFLPLLVESILDAFPSLEPQTVDIFHET